MKVVIFGATGMVGKGGRWYQALYDLAGPLYPLFRLLVPRYVTTTVNIGRAMIEVAASGSSKRILSSADINRLASGAGRTAT